MTVMQRRALLSFMSAYDCWFVHVTEWANGVIAVVCSRELNGRPLFIGRVDPNGTVRDARAWRPYGEVAA